MVLMMNEFSLSLWIWSSPGTRSIYNWFCPSSGVAWSKNRFFSGLLAMCDTRVLKALLHVTVMRMCYFQRRGRFVICDLVVAVYLKMKICCET